MTRSHAAFLFDLPARETTDTGDRRRGMPKDPKKSMLASNAGTAYNSCMQYTIRNLPAQLDRLIRKRAKEEGKSINTVAVEALMEAFGMRESEPSYRELSDLSGRWVDDPAVEEALEAQRGIDDEMWR